MRGRGIGSDDISGDATAAPETTATMSWRALRTAGGAVRRIGTMPDGILEQGTLVLDCDAAALARASGAILRVDPSREPQRIFALDRRRDGEISLLLRNGAAAAHLSVTLADRQEGVVRLIYRWRCATGDSLLTLGNGESRTSRWTGQGQVPAVTGDQITTLFTSRHGAFRHPAVTGFAVADHVMPTGPMPGLLAGTAVTTPDGPRSVETLRAGDLVLTAEDGWQPVLWQGGMEMPASEGFLPVRLVAPHHGLDHDLVVLRDQEVVLSGPDVEQRFGAGRVLACARDLIDGRTARIDPIRTATLHYHSVVLARPCTVHASGGWLQSLSLDAFARHPQQAASSVCADLHASGAMPRHDRPPLRKLTPFEVRLLRHMRENRRAPFAV